jgi:alkaline phosphatase
VEDLLDPLKGMKITSEGLAAKIGDDASASNVKALLGQWWGIDATDKDIGEILELVNGGMSMSYALSRVVSENHTVFGWTTHGHSGEDVPLWSYGPGRPVGLYDNTELAGVVASAFGFSMDKLNDRLFVEAGKAFMFHELDKSDGKNPVLKVGDAELPCGKNILRRNGVDTALEGIVVYAPMTDKVYVPRHAVSLLNSGAALEDITLEDPATTSTDIPVNCATYDFFSNTVHVPCFDNGKACFWLDLSILSFEDPVRFAMTGFGPY